MNLSNNTNESYFFVKNFLITIFSCYKEFDKRFAIINSKKISNSIKQQFTIMCKIFPNAYPTTIELVLSQLVKNNKVDKIGLGKNVPYIRNQYQKNI